MEEDEPEEDSMDAVMARMLKKMEDSKKARQRQEEEAKKNRAKNMRYITKKEVLQHSKKKDAWIILKKKVYDVTKFID